MWQSIYLENCFSPVPFIDPSRPSWEGGSGYADVSAFTGAGGGLGGGASGLRMGGWGEGEKRLMGSLAGPKDPTEEVCLEKRVFYRVISGAQLPVVALGREWLTERSFMRICRSARVHLGTHLRRLPRPDDGRMGASAPLRPSLPFSLTNPRAREQSPNLDCFITRIGQHPERLENMYFTYVLLLRALSRAGTQLVHTLEATHAAPEEVGGLRELVRVAGGCPSTFDESTMFSSGGKEALVRCAVSLSPSEDQD